MDEQGGGPHWQAVDPESRDGSCRHLRQYVGEVTVCMECDVEIEPLPARILDLGAARRRRAERGGAL